MKSFPALKPGVSYLIEHQEKESVIYVGTANTGIKLTSHAAILFIQKSNGESELKEIISEIGISDGQALEILQPLLTHNLISLSPYPATSILYDSDDFATQVSAQRITPELNLLAWRANAIATKELANRTQYSIHIMGENRLAYTLLEIFLAIGYSNCKVVNNVKGEVVPQLIGATPFRMSDIGQPLSGAIEKIKKEYALSLGALDQRNLVEVTERKTPDLAIKTSDFLPDQIRNLTLDGVPHLQVGNLISGKIEVGPIVIPGKSPCYNCIWLWKSGKFNKFAIANKVAQPLEMPAAGVTYLAGLLVTLIDSYFALKRSFLIGSSLSINLLKPLEYTERFWQPNPKCGCLELL